MSQLIKNEKLIVIPETEKVYGEITLEDLKKSDLVNKEIILAKYSEKQIKYLDANVAGEKIKTYINLAIFETGFKVENISELIIMVVKDIFSDFPTMTLSEISIAFRKGVRGELGEYMGLSVRTFYQWLKYYNEYKIPIIKQIQTIKKEEEITDEQKKKVKMDWLNHFIEDFEQYKKTKVSEAFDFKNLFYDYCVKNLIGYLNKDEKAKIKERAKKNVLSYHSKASNNQQRKEFKIIIQKIANNQEDKSVEELIIMESKRLAIPIIYNKLIENNLDLREIIYRIENN
jgi:hypothetical protein